jgi:putative ABC transport system permease protein
VAGFAGENPIGQQISVFGGPVRTIVGVVGDVHHNGLTTEAKRAWFVPHNQWANAPGSGGQTRRAMTLVARTTVDPMTLLRPVEETIRRMDPEIALTQIATLDDVVGDATREQRFAASAMSAFALLALILAAVGIYGVIAHAVGQRTREIGIRIALGANAGSVRSLVLRQGLVPAIAGIAVGLAAAFVLTRYLRAILFGVEPVDPLTFAAMPLVLLVVAAGAVLVPAIRASRIEPTIAMKT